MRYRKVEEFRKKHKENIEHLLQIIENEIAGARDSGRIPVYATKYRVKSSDSIFLKARRNKLEDLFDLGDLGGLRVLCLFDQDIMPTFSYLIEHPLGGTTIKKVKIFNFGDRAEGFKKEDVWSAYSASGKAAPQFEFSNKISGYRSIHILINVHMKGSDYPIEIQLRTLLQDVWGELEHKLLYKKFINSPQISSTFRRLQSDLTTMGEVLSNVKEETERDKFYDEFLMLYNGPDYYLEYEEHMLPDHILKHKNVLEKFRDYESFAIEGTNGRDYNFRTELSKRLNNLKQAELPGGHHLSAIVNPTLEYLLRMEEAYCLFNEGQLNEASSRYNGVIGDKKSGSQKYVPYFRLAEIEFIQGDIVKALRELDRAAEIIDSQEIQEFSAVALHNAYRIKVKTAYIYWLLGSDYIDQSIENISYAEKVLVESKGREDPPKFTAADEAALINNCCWYHLEKFAWILESFESEFGSVSDNDDHPTARSLGDQFKNLQVLYERLNQSINNATTGTETITVNALDTAAWFCYRAYLYTSDDTYLKDAIRYATQILGRKDRAGFKASINLGRHQRLREISAVARDKGLWP